MLTREEILELICSRLPDWLDPEIEEIDIDEAIEFIERDGDFDIRIEKEDIGEYVIDNPLGGFIGLEDGHWEPRIRNRLVITSKIEGE